MYKLDDYNRQIIIAISGDNNPENTYLQSYLANWEGMLNRLAENNHRRGFVEGYKAGETDEKEKFETSDAYQQGFTCGYDDGARENDNSSEAYQQGFKSGYELGHDTGIKSGIVIGARENDNSSQPYQQGYEEGFDLGHFQGFKKGHARGMKEGCTCLTVDINTVPQSFDDIPTDSEKENAEFLAKIKNCLDEPNVECFDILENIANLFGEKEDRENAEKPKKERREYCIRWNYEITGVIFVDAKNWTTAKRKIGTDVLTVNQLMENSSEWDIISAEYREQ